MTLRMKIRSGHLINVGQFNPLNTELNPICHLLALLGAHHILHVSRIRVNIHKYDEAESYFIIYFVTLRINFKRFMHLGLRFQ
jgi:hypothetical protein